LFEAEDEKQMVAWMEALINVPDVKVAVYTVDGTCQPVDLEKQYEVLEGQVLSNEPPQDPLLSQTGQDIDAPKRSKVAALGPKLDRNSPHKVKLPPPIGSSQSYIAPPKHIPRNTLAPTPHCLSRKWISRPLKCSFCGSSIYGIGFIAYQCPTCEWTIHKKCLLLTQPPNCFPYNLWITKEDSKALDSNHEKSKLNQIGSKETKLPRPTYTGTQPTQGLTTSCQRKRSSQNEHINTDTTLDNMDNSEKSEENDNKLNLEAHSATPSKPLNILPPNNIQSETDFSSKKKKVKSPEIRPLSKSFQSSAPLKDSVDKKISTSLIALSEMETFYLQMCSMDNVKADEPSKTPPITPPTTPPPERIKITLPPENKMNIKTFVNNSSEQCFEVKNQTQSSTPQ